MGRKRKNSLFRGNCWKILPIWISNCMFLTLKMFNHMQCIVVLRLLSGTMFNCRRIRVHVFCIIIMNKCGISDTFITFNFFTICCNLSNIIYINVLIEFFLSKVWGWNRTCGKIPISQWRPKTSSMAPLSKLKFQPILIVDSSEIRLWKSPERCEMNLSYSPAIFTKSSKIMFLCR